MLVLSMNAFERLGTSLNFEHVSIIDDFFCYLEMNRLSIQRASILFTADDVAPHFTTTTLAVSAVKTGAILNGRVSMSGGMKELFANQLVVIRRQICKPQRVSPYSFSFFCTVCVCDLVQHCYSWQQQHLCCKQRTRAC